MERNELRIGNWIYGSIYIDAEDAELDLGDEYSHEDEWIPTRVEGIPHEAEGYLAWVEDEYDRLKPIEITEYWLVKFGFKKYASSSICDAWFIGMNPVTMDYLFDITWMKNMDGSFAEIFYRNGHFKLKYVHQLQNLFFALTGKEVELKTESECL